MSESFKQLVLDMIGRMGRFHKVLLVLFMVHNFNVAINHTVTSFHTYCPPFHCRDNNDTKCKTDCPGGYVFESAEITMVTEFSLICKRRVLAPLINSLYFAGVTAGAIVCGSLADVYGRKIVVIFCLYAQGILGLSFYFLHNFKSVLAVRTIQGFFVQGLQGSTYALMLEQCNPKLRTLAGVGWQCTWALGMIFLATCAYFIPNWHELHLVLAIPTFITLFWIWVIPESLTWLIIRDRLRDAYILSVKLAKWNNDQIFLVAVEGLPITESSLGPIDMKKSKISTMLENRILRRHTYIMTTMWFSIALSYYGILYFLPNVAGERHLNFAMSAAVEIVALIVAYFIFAHFGRRIPMVVYQYVVAIFCFTIAILSIVSGKDGEQAGHWSRVPIATLAIVGKSISVSSFAGMFIYGGECFPTACRAGAMGLCGFFARIGSLISPQITLIGELTFKSCPLVIVGVMVTITATSTLLLPETLGIVLPNTIDDVDYLWGK